VGAWGVAIFADDLALDVRGDWRDAILDGAAPEEATRALEASYADALKDRDESAVFWLGLAAAQMETGRLLDSVRDRALLIIDAGGDVERWRRESEGLARQRAKTLSRLRSKLVGPQPAPKRLRRPAPVAVPFELGDVVLVRNAEAGTAGLVVVVDHLEDRRTGDRHPVVELLILPEDVDRRLTAAELRRLPAVRSSSEFGERPLLYVITTGRKQDRFTPEIGRIVARGVGRAPSADYRCGALERNAPCVSVYITWPGLVGMLRP
jgi:hypothetical protein